MPTDLNSSFATPYECGNQNQTTSWDACMAFYRRLAQAFPHVLQFSQIGVSDAGLPLYAGVVTADGVFGREQLKRERRPVFFNNNGIHPGEPEGIDACMALVRDFCLQPARLAALGQTVFLFIPVYNVDGCTNRNNTSRVNQDGPEQFGFRGNSLHLDLNRDFVKCDSRNAQVFNQFFTAWDPDVMVDTHTSNGADYHYTMTLIPTQPDKLGHELGPFLRGTMLPAIYRQMQARGWPTCPYVNPVQETPDQGIEDFLETPRFSTGYAALHHCIGFMPETHMLKPYADRYASMRALVETVLDFTVAHGAQILALRAAARQAAGAAGRAPLSWRADRSQPSQFLFKGYAAIYQASLLGNYTRLAYDRQQPWEKSIDHFDRFVEDAAVDLPRAYLIPQAWRAVIERLQWNGVQLQRLTEDGVLQVQQYRIKAVVSRPGAYEGHLFHDEVELELRNASVPVRAGDYLLPLAQEQARYAIETLEPQAHDSYFRWGFFNSVLEKKEAYSDYVFEDSALELLQEELELRQQFEQWKADHPALLSSQQAVLDFIFTHCRRYREPEWRSYPVLRVIA
ncbi:MAG: peptidase M14 [Burkholderiales bacterium]|nr:peptidase M14 [Burkholderiales bacterium]